MQIKEMPIESWRATIRHRRESQGVSINHLAKAIGVSPAFIWMLERGERGATIGTLTSIADYLGISRFKLLVEAKKIHPERIPRDCEEIIIYAINSGADFLESFPQWPLFFQEGNSRDFHISRARVGEKAMTALRDTTELHGVEIEPPIPVQEVAELLCGYEVVYTKNLSRRGEIDYVSRRIYVNNSPKYTKEQQRFVLAHEIGHHFMRVYDNFIEPRGYKETTAREIEANQFASALLMPKNWMAYYQNLYDLRFRRNRLEVASRLQVSLKMLEIRLSELQSIKTRHNFVNNAWQMVTP